MYELRWRVLIGPISKTGAISKISTIGNGKNMHSDDNFQRVEFRVNILINSIALIAFKYNSINCKKFSPMLAMTAETGAA